MSFYSVGETGFIPTEYSTVDVQVSRSHEELPEIPLLNLQEELSNAADELADILSAFGKFTKAGRKDADTDNFFLAAMLEEQADENMEKLLRQVTRLQSGSDILAFARNLFPNDCDLLLALKELLLSRKLTELQKKKIKEAAAELEKYGDRPKIQSGINVGPVAKRFSKGSELNAKELRESYLRFLDSGLPAGFVYQDWIDEYGCHNRKRMLAFTMSALIADMKSSEPGIHFAEFGPLSSKLTHARMLHTLDQDLITRFQRFPYPKMLVNQEAQIIEESVIRTYMMGLLNFFNFEEELKRFRKDFMARWLMKHRVSAMQLFLDVYKKTPTELYGDMNIQALLLDFMTSLITDMYNKEKHTGIWKEYYK